MIQNKTLNLDSSYGRIKNKIFPSELPANIKKGLFYKLSEIQFSKDVIHGDYTFSNVILSKNGKAFILYWACILGEKN